MPEYRVHTTDANSPYTMVTYDDVMELTVNGPNGSTPVVAFMRDGDIGVCLEKSIIKKIERVQTTTVYRSKVDV